MLDQEINTKTYRDTNAYQDEVDSVVTSILDGVTPVIPLSDSRQNAAVVVALLQSAREGKTVKV